MAIEDNNMAIEDIKKHIREAETFWNETPPGKVEDRTIAEIFDILEDVVDFLKTNK
jgi:hypothetical protein